MWQIEGLQRGGGVGLYVTTMSDVPDFKVNAAQGRNETEFNYWGSRFVFRGELSS